MKAALITYVGSLKKNRYTSLKRLSYHKIFVICNRNKVKEKLSSKFEIVPCNNVSTISKAITTVLENNDGKYIFFPFFRGDQFSQHNIKIYNHSFRSKIKVKVFKQKSDMNAFLDGIIQKKSFRYSIKELKNMKYHHLVKKIGSPFIVKPVNAASSLLNFKITDKAKFKSAQSKISSKFEYIIEEYMHGHLYALDFFFDGKDMFFLCFTREITFSEIGQKLSKKYMNIYQNILNENYMHFLPVRYTIDLKRIPPAVLLFLKDVKKRLHEIGYRGFVHLEYKFDKEKKKVGFIEWGARPGGKRTNFIKTMHNKSCESIPFDVIYKKDYSDFSQKNGFYYLKNRDMDKNIIGLKTNVLEKMHIMNVLQKHPDFMNHSFADFLKDLFKTKWKIRFSQIDFDIKTTPDYYIYPFYMKSGTRFDYFIELDESNFKQFLKVKYKIIENLIFHDY
jgi:hypothetical protein